MYFLVKFLFILKAPGNLLLKFSNSYTHNIVAGENVSGRAVRVPELYRGRKPLTTEVEVEVEWKWMRQSPCLS